MKAAIALAALSQLHVAAAGSVITAAPESRTVPTASVTIGAAAPRTTLDEAPAVSSTSTATAAAGLMLGEAVVVLSTKASSAATLDDDEEATAPGHRPSSASSRAALLRPYTHKDCGIGTAWPRGTTKPHCTKWTKVGDTHARWTQDEYTSTVTTTLTHKCDGCAIVWTTPHRGYAWAKIFATVTAAYPFTVTEVECEGPDGDGFRLPPHTPTEAWSTKTATQRYPSTGYITFPDHGPSTITPTGITSPTCTFSTMVYGGGGLRANKQLKFKYSTIQTITKDCGSCALAWSTHFFYHNRKGDFYHWYTVTNRWFVATSFECGPAVPTEAYGTLPPSTTGVTATTTTAR